MEKKIYRYPFRNTRMGGLTKVIVICLECRKILQPSRVERSRSGSHGEDYYVHEHPPVSVYLEQSNSGKRRITIPQELESIRDILETVWCYESSEVNDVITVLKAYLMSKSITSI
jgi:hypothetical protein